MPTYPNFGPSNVTDVGAYNEITYFTGTAVIPTEQPPPGVVIGDVVLAVPTTVYFAWLSQLGGVVAVGAPSNGIGITMMALKYA